MCYRIFHKPELATDWLSHSEHQSCTSALVTLDALVAGHVRGKWTVRNIRGELIAKATIGSVSTCWISDQLVLTS